MADLGRVDLQKAAVEVIKLGNSTVEYHLRQIQAESDLKAMDQSSNERDQQMREKKEELVTSKPLAGKRSLALSRAVDTSSRDSRRCLPLLAVKEQVKAFKADAKETFAAIQEAENNVEEAVSAAATERRNEGNLDRNDVAEQLAEIRAQLDMTSAISREVLNAYKKRKQEVS